MLYEKDAFKEALRDMGFLDGPLSGPWLEILWETADDVVKESGSPPLGLTHKWPASLTRK